MELHESAEDYLETILVLYERNGQVRSIDIVNEMNFSKPSISIAMKHLRENGYVTMNEDNYISLTEKGSEIANRIYNRHRTLTELLVKLGVPQGIAEKDACKIEHDLSPESYQALKDHMETLD